MANNLIGRKANQVPSNADLGDLAYQNTKGAHIKSGRIDKITNTPEYEGKRGPGVSPSILIDFANNDGIPGFIQLNRNSEQQIVDRTGMVKWLAPGDIACDHDPETLEPLGMRVELSMVNHMRHYRFGVSTGASPQFYDTQYCTWDSISTSETRAPDGTYTAAKLVADTSTNVHRIYSNNNPVYNVIHTFSFFVKKGPNYSNYVYIDCDNTSNSITFNIDPDGDGHVQNLNRTGIGTSKLVNWGIKKYPNGWFRCFATLSDATAGGGTSSNDWRIYMCNNTASNNFTGAGNETLYLWGAQLEANYTASSLIRSVGTSKTRSGCEADGTWGFQHRKGFGDPRRKHIPKPELGLTYLCEGTFDWSRDGGTNYYFFSIHNSASSTNDYLGLRMGGSSGMMAHQIYNNSNYRTIENGQKPDANIDYQMRTFSCAGSVGPSNRFRAATLFHKTFSRIVVTGDGDINSTTINPTTNENWWGHDGSLNYTTYEALNSADYEEMTFTYAPGELGYDMDALGLGGSGTSGAQRMRNGWIKKLAIYPTESDKETLIEMVQK
jgi:hypothetical protein